MNPYMITHSGRMFDLVEPTPDMVDINDIAHALSMLCRFTGHTKKFYSVAQHSVEASYRVPPAFALEALMHDAQEAYIGDLSSPLKGMIPAYRDIERNICDAIELRFALDWADAHQDVRHADMLMLAIERRDLLPKTSDVWPQIDGLDLTGIAKLVPVARPLEAEDLFLTRFHEITKMRAVA